MKNEVQIIIFHIGIKACRTKKMHIALEVILYNCRTITTVVNYYDIWFCVLLLYFTGQMQGIG